MSENYNLPMFNMLLSSVLALVSLVPSATLKFDAPAGWVSKTPSSTMRIAEFTLPRVAGDPEDAELAVFFFGASGGGGVQANVDRWIGQMDQPDGKASKDVAKTSTMTSHGLAITLVDVTGTYTAAMSPATPVNKPNFRP